MLDLGPQPPSNRYVPLGETDTAAHPLRLAQCTTCGLLQLQAPMPDEMVKSRYEWVTYNEPEGHLDALVAHLAGLPGVSASTRIAGLTYKDDTTLRRFERLGFHDTLRFDAARDLGLADPCAGLESVQAVLDDELAEKLSERHGSADLLIVRHVFEHAHAPDRFLSALRRLLAPNGRLVLETPDCRKFIGACDYSFVWEEHITYFTPATLDNVLRENGFGASEQVVYPYPLEDSLIAIASCAEGARQGIDPATRDAECAAGGTFASSYPKVRRRYREHLSSLREKGTRIAIFGAGHLAVRFLNFFGLHDCVECVIDDNPHKQGHAMPGSSIPIVDSTALPDIDLCLLSLSPESEAKVVANRQDFVRNGGRFASIFARSALALDPGPER